MLAEHRDKKIIELSGGMKRKLCVACALVGDPTVVLLDEPSARLDLGGREDLVRTLGDLATDPASPALVLVTHHLEEIPPGITHALLLGQGQMVAAGPLDQTLTNQLLSRTFGMNFDVRRIGERWSAVTSQS